MKLTRYKLGDICQMKYGKMPPKGVLADEGFPIFSGYRITGFAKEYLFDEPRVIVVARGVGGTGDVKLSPEKSWVTNLSIVLDHDSSVVDREFLYYRLGREPLKAKLNTGAAQAQITIENLSPYQITLPSIKTQRQIVGILTAYDDLVENNRRRIQLLEESARLLYKEWFVHLRFPGHEHVKVVDGVPEGWDKTHLSELVDTQYGFTETATDEPVGPKFLRGTDINKTVYIDWSTVPYCPEDKLDFRKYALKIGDIVVIRMADPGKVAIVETDVKAVFASYLVRLTRKEGVSIPPLYVFYVLSDDKYQGFISGASGGATRKSASAKLLVDFEVFVPPPMVVSMFVGQIEPLRSQIQILLQQNSRIREARDLLLPRLINGEIAV